MWAPPSLAGRMSSWPTCSKPANGKGLARNGKFKLSLQPRRQPLHFRQWLCLTQLGGSLLAAVQLNGMDFSASWPVAAAEQIFHPPICSACLRQQRRFFACPPTAALVLIFYPPTCPQWWYWWGWEPGKGQGQSSPQ